MVNSELLIDFVNTAEFDPPHEHLRTPAALAAWLSSQGLDPGSSVSKRDLEGAHAVREALRDLLSAHNEVEADVGRATAVLDAAALRSGLAIRFADGAARAAPSAPGARGALGRI